MSLQLRLIKFIKIYPGQFCVSFGNLAIAGLVVYYLGMSEYGVFTLKQSFYMVASAVSGYSTWTYVVSSLSRGGRRISNLIIEDVLFFLGFSALAAFFGIFVLKLEIYEFFLYILGAYFFNNGLVVGILRIEERYGLISVVQVVNLIFKIILIYMFGVGSRAIDPFVLFVASDVLIFGSAYFLVIFSSVSSNFVKIGVEGASERHAKNSLYFSVLADLPIQQVDRIIVSMFLTNEYLGVYALVRRVSIAFSQVVEPVSQIFLVYATRTPLSYMKKKNCFFASIAILLFGLVVMLLFNALYPYLESHVDELSTYDSIFYFNFIMLVYMVSSSFFWVHMVAIVQDEKYRYLRDLLISNFVFILLLPLLTDNYGICGAIVAVGAQQAIVIVLRFRRVWPLIGVKNGI